MNNVRVQWNMSCRTAFWKFFVAVSSDDRRSWHLHAFVISRFVLSRKIATATSATIHNDVSVRMRADTYILLIYLSFGIFGDAEKNESAFVATHEWQTVKKGEFSRSVWKRNVELLYANNNTTSVKSCIVRSFRNNHWKCASNIVSEDTFHVIWNFRKLPFFRVVKSEALQNWWWL